MKIRQFLLLTLILLFTALGATGVAADTLGDLKDDQSEIDSEITEKQRELEGVTANKNATLQDLDAIEDKLATLQDELDKLAADLKQAEADLARQQEEYEIIEANLKTSQDKMQTRLNSIYINGDVSYLDVLFSATSVSEFLSNFVFYEKIVEQDQSTIGTIKENKRLAKEKLDELAATKSTIESLTETKVAQEKVYNEQAEEKAEVVATLQAQEDTLEELIAEFRAESNRIAGEIQAIIAAQNAKKEEAEKNGGTYTGPTYTGNGSLGYPVSIRGIRTQNYGGSHTGVDIAASAGTPILAAEAGEVILVRYLTRSYGHYVVINHGSGLSTLYAHMNGIYVSVGDTVSKGQQIGEMGSTGRSTGPHLHFEVRVNGSCVNPDSYI